MTRFAIGDEVVSLASGALFTVAGIDDDCVLRGEDGAWLHEDDLDHAATGPDSLAPLFGGDLDLAPVRSFGEWSVGG